MGDIMIDVQDVTGLETLRSPILIWKRNYWTYSMLAIPEKESMVEK